MGADSDSKFIPSPSQGDFWGGYMMDFTWYKALAFFPLTGLLGIDQLALRSPFTAFLKFLVNIFFWGAWYIYDIIQILTDDTFVAKYGFSTPYGPRGHGYRFFSDMTKDNIEEFGKASPYNGGIISTLLFVVYFFMTATIGFTGIPTMIAGDFFGGVIKLFSNFLWIPFLFYIVGQFFELLSISSIGKDSIPHSFPLHSVFTIYENYPATRFMSEEKAKEELEKHKAKYDADEKAGKLPQILAIPLSLGEKLYEAASMYPPIAAFQTVSAAKGAVQSTSDMAESAAKVGEKLASAVEERITKNPDAVIDALLGEPKPQTGGGLVTGSGSFDILFFGGMATLILGGLAIAFLRKINLPKRNEDESPRKISVRDDSPPNPGRV